MGFFQALQPKNHKGYKYKRNVNLKVKFAKIIHIKSILVTICVGSSNFAVVSEFNEFCSIFLVSGLHARSENRDLCF